MEEKKRMKRIWSQRARGRLVLDGINWTQNDSERSGLVMNVGLGLLQFTLGAISIWAIGRRAEVPV